MTPSRLWIALLAVAGAFAAVAVGHWIDALVTGRPVLYGEGAVANAAILLRDGNPYAPRAEFVAANYPPLYLLLAGIADPFRAGRLVTIAAALAVAVILWWRARGAGRVPGVGLALTWLALAPVAVWGAAVKPDMLAVALTLAGVAALDRALRPGLTPSITAGRLAIVAGALLGAAMWAKPTALLPATAVLVYAVLASRPVTARALAGAVTVGAIALLHASTLGVGDVWRHIVVWNALPWSAEQELLVLVAGVAMVGIVVVLAAGTRAFRGVALAYAAGAFGVALLGGREGATINYLLDLAAATLYALASVAPRMTASRAVPVGALVQVALAFAVVAPFSLVPGREGGTGEWGAAERLDAIRSLPAGERYLVEDSGLLIATGMRPVIDDLFLYSRLLERGEIGPGLVTGLVGAGEYAAIVAEADLARLADARASERARWHPLLVREVLARYELAKTVAVRGRTLLWIYRPR